DIMEEACAFFQKALHGPKGHAGMKYFARRGIAPEALAVFRLGYAPDSRNALKNHLAGKGITEKDMIEAGLLIRPERGGLSYDRFRGRVIFPIFDSRGRVIAFGGRILDAGEPKYLNSPETPLFHKGKLLYGMFHARRAAQEKNSVLVAEGYMDVIALHQAGF